MKKIFQKLLEIRQNIIYQIKLNNIQKKKFKLPSDLKKRISREYVEREQEIYVISSLNYLNKRLEGENIRILRCIIFLSKGDIELFKKNVNIAMRDWRDIIQNAEYDKNEVRIFNFNKTFAKNRV